MTFRASTVPTTVALGSLMVLGFTGLGPSAGSATPHAQTSCFAINATVACIDAGFVPHFPGATLMPAIIGPAGSGENEDTVIREDGGREVARG